MGTPEALNISDMDDALEYAEHLEQPAGQGDYYIRGQAKRDFRKGCDKGSNPHEEGTFEYYVYNDEMEDLFETEQLNDLRGPGTAPY